MGRKKRFNRKAKVAVSWVLTIFIAFSCFVYTPTANAEVITSSYMKIDNGHYRIYHEASGKYLGINKDEHDQNGARLRIQDEQYGNQSQIFYIAYKGDINGHPAYQIRVHGADNKIIEVRNASKNDWGEISQWNDDGQNSGLWYITRTYSSEIRFENVNSGKMLNVAGGNSEEGNPLIQYHSDWTSSEMFTLKKLGNEDILGAVWTRDLYSSGVCFQRIENANQAAKYHSMSPWSVMIDNDFYYPDPKKGERLAMVLYLSSEETAQLLVAQDPPTSITDELWETVVGEFSEIALDTILSTAGIKCPIPSGMLLGWANTFYGIDETERWNDFKRFVQTKSASVKINIYYSFKFEDASSYMPVLNTIVRLEFVAWNGKYSTIKEPGYTGTWEYSYK